MGRLWRCPRSTERGITGIIEIVIMLAILGIIFPMVLFGVDAISSDSAVITAKSVATGKLNATISAAVQQLSGAEPEPYCPDAYGAASTKRRIYSTPLQTCAGPAQGPPATSVGNPTILVPPEAMSSCEPHGAVSPHGSLAALLIATPSCVGFLGYNYESSATTTTPLAFPYETLLWVQPTSGELELTEYTKVGTWDGTSCTTGTATYTDGCWLSSTVQTRALGMVSGSSAIFTYVDSTGTVLNPYASGGTCTGANSPSTETSCASTLASITTVDVKAKFTESGSTSVTSTFRVPIYGGIDANQNGLGTTP
jgi:hypothetical protein